MASFQAKTGGDRLRVTQKKKVVVLIHSNPTRNREIQKNSKKYKKLRKIIMASFQAKTGRDRLRVIPKQKSYRSDPFQPDQE